MEEKLMQWASMEFSRERRSSFSLRSRATGPLDFDGARRENVLRGAGYSWTPGLRVFPCFGCFEAVRGRLIGPKTWDRTCGIYLRFLLGP